MTLRDHSDGVITASKDTEQDYSDMKDAYQRLEFISWTHPHLGYLPDGIDGDISANHTGRISVKQIADTLYNGKHTALPGYYTDLYEDFPLLVAAELTKRVVKNKQPEYLKEIVDMYKYLLSFNYINRSWANSILKFYGPLSVSMTAIYGHIDVSLELANMWPKLHEKKKQPDSISMYLKVLDRWHMEGTQSALTQKEIYEGISNEWKQILLDIQPTLSAVWDQIPTFEGK